MKKLNHLTILVAALMALLPLRAQAVPFIPTSNPAASSTHWYQLHTGSNYAYCMSFYGGLCFSAPSPVPTDDPYLWCFVGDESSGYKVFNKQAQAYLGDGVIMTTDPNAATVSYIEMGDGDNFYIYTGAYGTMYLGYSTADGSVFQTINKSEASVFTVNEVATPHRFDADGVGYSYVDGGRALNIREVAANLLDGDTGTKFFAITGNFWVTMRATQAVTVRQYSLVTANDSRGCYDRMIRNWKLQGSNDGSTWEDINVQSYYPMPYADRQEVVFNVYSNRQYTYFKLSSTETGDHTIQLSEVWINAQQHDWGEPATVIEPTCGTAGQSRRVCSLCGGFWDEQIPATGRHTLVNGECTTCGTPEGTVTLLENGQTAPYTVKAMRGNRNANGTWPEPPFGWNYPNYYDYDWIELTMPTASEGHTKGPFKQMMYNSTWFGEYNYYWIRRTFNLSSVDPDAVFTFHTVHDDNMVVYVNGSEVINQQGWTSLPDGATWETAHETFTIPASVFTEGKNVLAVYMQQNYGGAYFDCMLTMKSPGIAGDVTGDGVVDVDDMNQVINVILGIATSDKADANGDGTVDIDDLNEVINIMLGK